MGIRILTISKSKKKIFLKKQPIYEIVQLKQSLRLYKFPLIIKKGINSIIRKSINIFQIMQTALLQYYSNGDISLMKQFLLTVPLFNEIHHFLQNQKFYQFLKSVDVHPAFCSQPFQLKQTSIYLFLSQGILISNKERRQNFHKLTRLSRTMRLTHLFLPKENFDQPKQRQSQAMRTIQPNQMFNQPLFYNTNYLGEKLFYVSQKKKSALIEIDFSKIDAEIVEELRQKHNQKLKFITGLNLFRKVQKYLIENNLSKFQILKVHFDECLMKQPNLRTNHLVFLTTGEVQIFPQHCQGKKPYLTKAPAVLGFDRVKSVKSVTEYCLCYYIEKNEVSEILKRNLQSKYKNSETEEYLNKLTESIVMTQDNEQKSLQKSTMVHSSPIPSEDYGKTPRLQRNPTAPTLPQLNIQNDSLILKSKSSLFHNLTPRVPQNKKYRIQQHFPNFINGNLSILDIKKSDYMLKIENNDSLLYQMKSRQPKQPQMDKINKKLKNQRLNKINKCKQNIIQTKEYSLNSVNLRIYEEFQDSKIINKIRRKIQQDITKKKRVNKNWRSHAHNSVAFNKIADLSLVK